MTASAQAAAVIREALAAADVEWEEPDDGTFVAVLPGQARLRTTVALSVGEHALSINAFVARRPDENHEAVYRWLLERNRRLYAVSFAIDALGDIYLVGRLPLAAVSTQEVDRVLGSVLEYADGSFNTILELGFATSIRREWAWRVSRGESLDNLQAFTHLVDHEIPDGTT